MVRADESVIAGAAWSVGRGDEVPLELRFELAGTLTTSAPVQLRIPRSRVQMIPPELIAQELNICDLLSMT